MFNNNSYPNFKGLLGRPALAMARIRGSEQYPDILGLVRFYQTPYGVIVLAELKGLPNPSGDCESPIFGFHIHEGEHCTGDASDPFADVRTHYNPNDCPHPYHSGDLPPLFGANGYAFLSFLTDRFTVDEIIGRTIIVHASPDDFTTQPSGNAGIKMACGEIVR
ncbi:MAG: superoxide dismutase family protein [Clostridia bacterium]|nr:superoxide dismutase family protein [Clostridia bacterium]